MAVTQYIGARYVPLFYTASDNTNNWEAGVQYEPLTIVTYLNQSYASKKPVPVSVGNPADNPDYWVITGAYNAQVAQMQQDLDDLELRVDTVEDKVKDYPGYVMIGDSYGYASGSHNGWIDKLAVKFGLTEGVDLFSSSVGGSGLLTSPTSFYTQLQSVISGMTADEIASVGNVIIIGGSNDMGHTVAELEPAVETLVNAAKTNFPNAVVWMGMGSGNYDNHFATAQKSRIVEAYRKCGGYGAKYLNNLEYCLHDRSLINPDKVHPNNNGYVELTNAICAALNGSYNYKYQEYGLVLTPINATTVCNYSIDIDNGFAKIQSTSTWDIQRTDTVDVGYNKEVDIGAFANLNMLGDDLLYYQFNRTQINMVITIANGGNLKQTAVTARIDDIGHLWIRNVDVEASGSTSMYATANRFIIPQFTIMAPTLAC